MAWERTDGGEMIPKTIARRYCPQCQSDSWSIQGWSYPAGDDSWWRCYNCDYKGRPSYSMHKITIEGTEE